MANTVTMGHIDIQYVCEKCGRPDTYAQALQAEYSDQSGNYKGPRIEAENLAEKIKDLTKKRDEILAAYKGVEIRGCPGCHQHQSWMADSERREKLQVGIGGIALVTALVLSVIAYVAGPGGAGLDSLVGFFLLFLLISAVISKIVYSILANRGPKIDASQLKSPPVMVWKA